MAEWILDDWEDNLTLSTSLNLNTHGWVDDEYWFSRGGMVFQAALQNPISVYLDRHETKSAIRSLYNNFSALFYPDVIALTEEYRMWKHASGPLYKTPDEARMVGQIIDLLLDEKEGEIRLGNGIPQRWLEPGQQVVLRGLRIPLRGVQLYARARCGPGDPSKPWSPSRKRPPASCFSSTHPSESRSAR